MGIFDTLAAMPRKVQGTVYVEPLAKVRVCVFDEVQPGDCLVVPRSAGAGFSDIKVYGPKRRLGRKRCRVDETAGLIQVLRPPKSRSVTVRWIEHEGLRVLGAADVSMVSTTTYRSVEETWTADVDAITPGKLGDDAEATLRNLRGY